MWASRLGAPRIQTQCMVGDGKALGLGDRLLAVFDFGVVKLFDLAAVKADQVVVVLAFVELVDRFATFKLAAREQTGLLELHQHTVNGGQADIDAFFQNQAVHILGAHVALPAFLEQLQDRQARHRRFESGVFQVAEGGHAGLSSPRACS